MAHATAFALRPSPRAREPRERERKDVVAVTKAPLEARSLEGLLRELTFEFFGSGKHRITSEELLSAGAAVLLDVRSDEELDLLSLRLAPDLTVIHIPTHEVPDRVEEIPVDLPVAVFCTAGTRAAMVYLYLHALGFDQVRVLSGGLSELVSHALPGAIWKRRRAAGNAS